jgi:hypothetical protein
LNHIIRSIHTCETCSHRAYLFEARVGEGKLLASWLRIDKALPDQPEAQYLFGSMLRYATSDGFMPAAQATHEQFEGLCEKVSVRAVLKGPYRGAVPGNKGEGEASCTRFLTVSVFRALHAGWSSLRRTTPF